MSQINLTGLGAAKDYYEFEERLQWAENQSDILQLGRFYKSHFPNVKDVIKVGNNLKLQRQGIDTIVVLETGKHVYFDEKIRAADWGDFFLEEYSVWKDYHQIVPPQHLNLEEISLRRNEPVPHQYERFLKRGWIHGKKITDYITYVIEPTGRVDLLPFLLLQRAWDKHYLDWLKNYERRPTPNRDYTTTNIPVPRDVLYKALYEEGIWGTASQSPVTSF